MESYNNVFLTNWGRRTADYIIKNSQRRRKKASSSIISPFVWLVADGWCWFVLREKYCWLIASGWFVLREKYCWLVADKSSEQGV
jgi:hypothetical protein